MHCLCYVHGVYVADFNNGWMRRTGPRHERLSFLKIGHDKMISNGDINIGRCYSLLYESLIPSHELKAKTIDSELSLGKAFRYLRPVQPTSMSLLVMF